MERTFVGLFLKDSDKFLNFYPLQEKQSRTGEWEAIEQPKQREIFKTEGNLLFSRYSASYYDNYYFYYEAPKEFAGFVGLPVILTIDTEKGKGIEANPWNNNDGKGTAKMFVPNDNNVRCALLYPAFEASSIKVDPNNTNENVYVSIQPDEKNLINELFKGKKDLPIIIYDTTTNVICKAEPAKQKNQYKVQKDQVYSFDDKNRLELNLYFFDWLRDLNVNKYTSNNLAEDSLRKLIYYAVNFSEETLKKNYYIDTSNGFRIKYGQQKTDNSLEKNRLKKENEELQKILGITENLPIAQYLKKVEHAKQEAEAGAAKAKEEQEEAETAKVDALKKAADAQKQAADAQKQAADAQKKAKKIIDDAENARNAALQEKKEAEKTAHAAIDAVTEKLNNPDFAGVAAIKANEHLANVLMKASANWEKEHETDGISETVQQLNDADIKQPDNIKNFLFNSIQGIRPHYSKNDIMNLAICMTQGFLTVLSGSPGSGKTSICRSMAALLGLNRPLGSEECRRFVDISVGRGWTSQRDFIGYYNPLSGRFETSNRDMYNALQMLNAEAEKGSKYPLYVLLDEANLSPMEHYWSDFIGICDAKKDSDRVIDCGGGKTFMIPETLRFLATINNDDTTTTLSPRLIDRAWVITLPEPTLDQMLNSKKDELTEADLKDLKRVSWDILTSAFGAKERDGKLRESLYDALVQLMGKGEEYKKYKGENDNDGDDKDAPLCGIVSVSPRIFNAMLDYCSAAVTCFKDEEGRTKEQIAIDYAIAQKILPQINVMEYSGGSETSGVSARLDEAAKWFNDNKYFHSEEIMGKIIERGKGMDYYRFF